MPSTLNVYDLRLRRLKGRREGLTGPWTCAATPSILPYGYEYFTDSVHLTRPRTETMTALMLRYVEGYEETAYQYARALVRRLTADLSAHDALRLARDIVTEVTNDIGIFEEEEVASRIDVALRRPIDRVEAELDD